MAPTIATAAPLTNRAPVPTALANVAPEGTKMWILNVGYLECDAGFFLRGGNTSTFSNPEGGKRERRPLAMYCVLLDIPTIGLVLYETGCGHDYPEVWGAPVNDIFARVKYDQKHELDAAIAATGNSIEDIKMVIMGHLHLDHAGGLEYFKERQVPIWVHEEELKHGFYALATGEDVGVYLPHYMKFEHNWKTFSEPELDIAPGITIHHFPGHTPGLCGIQVNLRGDGSFLFTSDMYHVKENMEGQPQGWLARDHSAWFRSHQKVHRIQMTSGCRVIPGHDYAICEALWAEKDQWE